MENDVVLLLATFGLIWDNDINKRGEKYHSIALIVDIVASLIVCFISRALIVNIVASLIVWFKKSIASGYCCFINSLGLSRALIVDIV